MRRVIMLPLLLGVGALAMTTSGTRAQEEPRVVARPPGGAPAGLTRVLSRLTRGTQRRVLYPPLKR